MRPDPLAVNRPRRRARAAVLRAAVVAALAAVVVAGCGSRGPLDSEGTAVDAGMEATVEADIPDVTPDRGPPDAGVDAPPGPLDCATCVGQQCGPLILTCLLDTSCRTILQCAAQKCFGGAGGGGGGGAGGVDPVCLLQCASGQGKGAGEALQVVQCLTQTCSDKCGGILGGLGGFGGQGGPGGMPGDEEAHREALRQIFSPWPELSSSFDAR